MSRPIHPHGTLTGYYGHVAYVAPTVTEPIIGVSLIGRVGAEADEETMGRKPWPLYPCELEHAD